MSVIRVDNTDKTEFDRALEELRGYFSVLSQNKGRPATYSLLTYGCQLNESDSEKLAGMLAEMGLVKSEDSGETGIFSETWEYSRTSARKGRLQLSRSAAA